MFFLIMENRVLSGLIFLFLGLFLLLLSSFFGLEALLVSLIYSLPLVLIGIFIIFNKKEDKIEQINYFKLERRKNEKK